jgi:hypothetical protein
MMAQYGEREKKTDVEVFYGWEGMRTVFEDLLRTLGKKEYNYVFGAGTGYDSAQADIFFAQYYEKKQKRGFGTKIIFSETMRTNSLRTKPLKDKPDEMRFLDQDTFAEINTYKDVVLFILLLKKPVVIRIISQEAANTCRLFFDRLWVQAKA